MPLTKEDEIILPNSNDLPDELKTLLVIKARKVKQTFQEILKEMNGEKIYPKDIFPEISEFQLQTINDLLLTHLHFPLDRLSAHIARLILKGKEDIIKQHIPEEWSKEVKMELKILISFSEADIIRKYLDLITEDNIVNELLKETQIFYSMGELGAIIKRLKEMGQ